MHPATTITESTAHDMTAINWMADTGMPYRHATALVRAARANPEHEQVRVPWVHRVTYTGGHTERVAVWAAACYTVTTPHPAASPWHGVPEPQPCAHAHLGPCAGNGTCGCQCDTCLPPAVYGPGHQCPREAFLDDPITRAYGVGGEMVRLIPCSVCDEHAAGEA